MARAIFQTVSSAKRKGEIMEAMKVLRDRTRSCLGCLESSVEQDIEDLRKIRLTVIFDSREHFQKFIESEILISIFQLVELSIERPDIFFCWEDGNESIDSIMAMKTAKRHPHNSPSV